METLGTNHEGRFSDSDCLRSVKITRAIGQSIRNSRPPGHEVGKFRATWRESCPFAGGSPSSVMADDPIVNDLIELEGE